MKYLITLILVAVTFAIRPEKLHDLESLVDLATADNGVRKVSFCVVNVERSDCSVNITSVTVPCPVNAVVEHLYPKVDFARVTGAFLNAESSLISTKVDFTKVGQRCNVSDGTVEVNVNSTGRHVRIVDRKYLPLRIVLLQAIWSLGVDILRSVDMEINGVFLSDTLGENVPQFEGVIFEVQKPKGLTIFEFKTTNLHFTQLKSLLDDFYVNLKTLTRGISAKTIGEVGLDSLQFQNATLIGYIEPNIMFEFQLSGTHVGSSAFSTATNVYITVQKYHGAVEPSVAVFGKFNKQPLPSAIIKLATFLDTLSGFAFVQSVTEFALVLASDKLSIINIKEAREASDTYYCKECRAKYLAGVNIVFRVDDTFELLKAPLNLTNSSVNAQKKTIISPKESSQPPSLAMQKIPLYLGFLKRSQIQQMSKINKLHNKQHIQRDTFKTFNYSSQVRKRSTIHTVHSSSKNVIKVFNPYFEYYDHHHHKSVIKRNKVSKNHKKPTENSVDNFILEPRSERSVLEAVREIQRTRGGIFKQMTSSANKRDDLTDLLKTASYIPAMPMWSDDPDEMLDVPAEKPVRNTTLDTFANTTGDALEQFINGNTDDEIVLSDDTNNKTYINTTTSGNIFPNNRSQSDLIGKDNVVHVMENSTTNNTNNKNADNTTHYFQSFVLTEKSIKTFLKRELTAFKSSLQNNNSLVNQTMGNDSKLFTSKNIINSNENTNCNASLTNITVQNLTEGIHTVAGTFKQQNLTRSNSSKTSNSTTNSKTTNNIELYSTNASENIQMSGQLKKAQLPASQEGDSIAVFANIREESVTFEIPQQMEGALDRILEFLNPELLVRSGCLPFRGTAAKFDVNKITVTSDRFMVTVNLTNDVEVVKDLFTIRKGFGVTLLQDKELDFDDQVTYTGVGREIVLDEEIEIHLSNEHSSKSCSVTGDLTSFQTLQNVTQTFGVVPKGPLKSAFAKLLTLPLQSIQFSTKLAYEKFIRIKGDVSGEVKAEALIWRNSTSKQKQISISLSTQGVVMNELLGLLYGVPMLPEWLTLQQAGILFSNKPQISVSFEDPFISTQHFQAGVSFVGILSAASNCENKFAVNNFCQFVNKQLSNVAGSTLQGTLQEDSFSLVSRADGSILLGEVTVNNPVVLVTWEEGRKGEVVVAGEVVINIGEQNQVQVKGRFTEQDGIPALQIGGPLVTNLFNSQAVALKPLIAYTSLDEQIPSFEVIGSHILLGTSSSALLKVINSFGKFHPSTREAAFFCGDIKDLSFAKLAQAFGLDSDQDVVIKDATFAGIVKVVYAEDDMMEVPCMSDKVNRGITLEGRLKVAANSIVDASVVIGDLDMKWRLNWPLLSFSKQLITVTRSQNHVNKGPILDVGLPLANHSLKEPSTIKGHAQAIGMQDSVQMSVFRKVDGFLYFTFNMQGRMFGELEMMVQYNGSERGDDDFKMAAHPVNLTQLRHDTLHAVRQTFDDFIALFLNYRRQNDGVVKNATSMTEKLNTSLERDVRARLKDLIIELDGVEANIRDYVESIEADCVEQCAKYPVEIQTVSSQDFSNQEVANLELQVTTAKWALNVSCVAVCEVGKGIALKKSQETLSSARVLYPLYKKQKLIVGKLSEFLSASKRIEQNALAASHYFHKHSIATRKLINRYRKESLKEGWFTLNGFSLSETLVSSLKGKLPCLKVDMKVTIFKEAKEITQPVCFDGELHKNIACVVFDTISPEARALHQARNHVRSVYAEVERERNELMERVDATVRGEDDEVTNFMLLYGFNEEVSRRNEIQRNKTDDPFDVRFNRLASTVLPQYSVHSLKTTRAMQLKSPWAVLRQVQTRSPVALPPEKLNTTAVNENECSTILDVARKFGHVTTLLSDLVDAYEDGKGRFATSRDQLVDSMHDLDQTITNEANRTYYTKGQLKDMIYWSVRVWKGVEEWVEESTRQFEDHNRNAVAMFTDQLDQIYGTEKTYTAADYLQMLSHIGTNAMKKMVVDQQYKRSSSVDHEEEVQNIALVLTTLLRNKDITLDEAATRVPSLKSQVRALLSKASLCDILPAA